MTNVFQKISEEQVRETTTAHSSSTRPFVMLGILCIALCIAYVTSVRMMQASEYSLQNSINSRDNVMKQYGELGRQLDSLRSLSVISQAPILAGFQEVQKPSYLNMDASQSVAVAGTKVAQ